MTQRERAASEVADIFPAQTLCSILRNILHRKAAITSYKISFCVSLCPIRTQYARSDFTFQRDGGRHHPARHATRK